MALRFDELRLNEWAAAGQHNGHLNLVTGPFGPTRQF